MRHNDELSQTNMRFSRKLRHIAVSARIGCCLGCGGKVPLTHYYVLSLPAPQPAVERLDFTAILLPIRESRVISQDRIVYRESPEQVGFYEYHRWAEDPSDSIAGALRRQLLARGTFSSVTLFDGRTTADYLLRGHLQRLEEIDYGTQLTVSVEITLDLVDPQSARVAWSDSTTQTAVVEQSDVRSVVQGMSKAVEQGISELCEKLDNHLRTRN